MNRLILEYSSQSRGEAITFSLVILINSLANVIDSSRFSLDKEEDEEKSAIFHSSLLYLSMDFRCTLDSEYHAVLHEVRSSRHF